MDGKRFTMNFRKIISGILIKTNTKTCYFIGKLNGLHIIIALFYSIDHSTLASHLNHLNDIFMLKA